MIRNAQLAAGPADGGSRLDAFVLARCPASSRAFVRDALARGDVSLNGRPAPKGAKVRPGDAVAVRELLERADNRVRPDPSVKPAVVYEDGAILAADKPAGMAVQPLSPREGGTLAGGLVALHPELAEVGDEPLIAGAVHRIDAGTSGLVLFARSDGAFAAMRRAFAAREVVKTYLALVEGRVRRPGRVACGLVHDPAAAFCRMVAADAPAARPPAKAPRPMWAETAYRPLHPAGPNTLVEVTILTGVTHQIRAQLAMAGFPIVGDALYGARTGGAFRLHSLAADFPHPATGARLRIEAPRPDWAR